MPFAASPFVTRLLCATIPRMTPLDNLPLVGPFFLLYPYQIAFFLLLVEECGLPLPLPGDLVALYVATYAPVLGVEPLPFIFGAVLASTFGSLLLYTVSYHLGTGLLQRYGPFLHVTPSRLARVQRFAADRNVFSLLILRLLPGLRIATSLAAGSLRIDWRKFVIANTLAALLWWSGWWYIGSHLGLQAVELLATVFRHAGLALLLAVAVVLLLILRQRARKRTAGSRTLPPTSL